MTRGIERGAPFDGAYKQEAELVGPYPVWALWKHSLDEYLKRQGVQINNGIELVLKEFYIKRRLFQKGEIGDADLREFNKRFLANHPDIFQGPQSLAVRFITANTEKSPVKRR